MAQLDPSSFFRSHVLMPTSMSTRELVRLDPVIRQRTFFSATVECEKLLDGIRGFVQECIQEGCTEGEFIHRVNQWLWENAQLLGEDYPTGKVRDEEWDAEEARRYERSVRHIDSLARLRLIFRTQAEMCAGFSDFQRDMQPEALSDYPGWKFVRMPGAKTFRKDHVEHQGEVRLKNDFDYWLARNDPSFGGFNNPYPPFGFNSWMWTSPVSYAKCVRLGLLEEGEEVTLSDEQRKQWGLDDEHAAEVIRQMLDRLCKYPQEESDEPGDGELEEPEPLCKDWGGIPEDMQDKIEETMKALCDKYGLSPKHIDVEKLESYDDGIAAYTQDRIISFNTDDGVGGIFAMGGEGYRAYDTPQGGGFTRPFVGSTTSGCDIRYTSIHEYGHLVHFDAGADFGKTTEPAYMAITSAFKKAVANKDIYTISANAARNQLEFFAECFTARETGEPLPDYILDMLDTVHKMADGKGVQP